MSLAAKLPYDHPYAGGFSGLGGQALPTDSDCLTYLAAVKAADGAGVEVGVATAVDAFVKALKADSLWESIGSSCLLCGPRTITGALVPLRGIAPTAEGGWSSGDYDRSTGMTGDGTSLYIDANRANNADPQDSKHIAVYATTLQTTTGFYILGDISKTYLRGQGLNITGLVNGPFAQLSNGHVSPGFLGATRISDSSTLIRGSGTAVQLGTTSETPSSNPITVFGTTIYSDATLAFYTIGSSIDLAKLDSHISSYVTAIGAAI
jgi:hypothetical protein